jgi:DNA-directed RNA polymerase specialized sigma24 family protein
MELAGRDNVAHAQCPPSDDTAEESDESLMLRFAGGDIAAFDVLYARHELGVWRYVFRSVRVQAVADDLLQDVWFAVARSAPTYTVSARFKTWLFTMAHNRLIDHFRTAKHHVSIDGTPTTTAKAEASPIRWRPTRASAPCGGWSPASRPRR